MPLYLHACIPQLTPVISIAIAVIANSVPQLLTRWWYGSDFIEFHEKGAVSFWFGNGRLGVLTVSLLYNVGRLIYVCLVQDVIALLIAARVLGYIVQLYDHYWMQHYWLTWFVQAQKRTELWLRFYLTIIAFLTYALVDLIQVGIVGNYQIYFHQYVPTTMFYTSMLFCLVFWFMWFLLPFNNIHPTAARSPSTMLDVPRMVRYRFHIMRNSVASWIPFLLLIGIVGVFGGDDVPTADLNDNNLQWRYPFMVAALLAVVAWVLHRYTVAPYDRLMLRGLSEHTPEANADADARLPAAEGPPASFVQVDITRATTPGTRQPPPRPPVGTSGPPVSDDRDGSSHPSGSESGEASTAGLEQLLIAAMSERQMQSPLLEQQHQQGGVVPGGGVPPSERSGAADAGSDSNSEAEIPPAALEQLLVVAMSERQTQSQRREQSHKDPSQSQVEGAVGLSERSAVADGDSDSNSNPNSAPPPSNLEQELLAATTEQRLEGAVEGAVGPSERSAVADADSDSNSATLTAIPPSNLSLAAMAERRRQLQEGVVPAPVVSGQNDGTAALTGEMRPRPVPEPGPEPEPSPRLQPQPQPQPQPQERSPPQNLHLELPATTGSNRSGSAAATAAAAEVALYTSRRSVVSTGDGGASSKAVQATPRRKALTVRDIRRAHRASLSSVAAIGSDVGGGAGRYVNGEGEGDGSNKKGGDLGNGAGDGSAKDANDTGKGGSAKSNDNERDIEEGDVDGDDDDEGSSRRNGRLYRMPTLNKLPSQISELSMNVSRRAHSLAHLFPFDVVDLMRPLEIKKWEIFERNADKAVCVFFQILLWNIIVCTSQDMMAFYFVYGNHWMGGGWFCQKLVEVETVNVVQFLFDHLVG